MKQAPESYLKGPANLEALKESQLTSYNFQGLLPSNKSSTIQQSIYEPLAEESERVSRHNKKRSFDVPDRKPSDQLKKSRNPRPHAYSLAQ